jgi:F0F1-type ATP synthase epsilon subunit
MCNVTTPEFSNRHENVKKVRIELKSGIAEVFPNHQDLLGTIGIGIIQIEESIDDKSIISTYVSQDGLVTIDNSKSQNIETTVIDILSAQTVQITKELTYDYSNEKYEETKAELDKLFNVNANQDRNDNYEEFEDLMQIEFFSLQKEIAFWDKIRLAVKDRDKRN